MDQPGSRFPCVACVLVVVSLLGCAVPGGYAVVDGHMHVYDTERPEGVPWPTEQEAKIFRPHLPAEYRELAEQSGIESAVLVITGEWEADNAWNLDQIRGQAGLFPAFIGNLRLDVEPDEFRAKLDPLLREPQFKGIRVVNKSEDRQLNDRIMTNIHYLADHGMVLEILCLFYTTDDIVRIAEANPDLPIVLSSYRPGADQMRRLGPLDNVHLKVGGGFSEVAWATFGEDRLVFGSNWPTLFLYAESLADEVAKARQALTAKGADAERKVMRDNAVRLYGLAAGD